MLKYVENMEKNVVGVNENDYHHQVVLNENDYQ